MHRVLALQLIGFPRIRGEAGSISLRHQWTRRGWKELPAWDRDQVKSQFAAKGPTAVWFCAITRHRARNGSAYCAAGTRLEARRSKFDGLLWEVWTSATVAAHQSILSAKNHAS